MTQEQQARLQRLFLLLLLALASATACPAEEVEPEPMARAWKILKKRDWFIQRMTATPRTAQLCCDNQGVPLRGAKSPLILVARSHLILTLPQCIASNLPEVSVQIGDGEPLPAVWQKTSNIPSLEVTLPETVQSGALVVSGAGKVLWQHYAYITHALPLAPQVPAWRGVLDDACRWAKGAYTPKEIIAKLTHGLFTSGRFVYPANDPTKRATFVKRNTFALKNFLSEEGPRVGNCVDISDYLVICAAALGVPLRLVQLTDSQNRLLVTNPICPIGWDASDPESYQSVRCTMHQVAYLPGENRLFDACFFSPRTGSSTRNPVPTFSWDAAQIQNYWQSEDTTRGFVSRPHQSVPLALLSAKVPAVE
ncbi:hypothetical protein [Armatimonas sp.]|uniref:hypothetical protein n=1 Tax=Armatimonas sp. TaxID=1872638 RepID=UPI0037534233